MSEPGKLPTWWPTCARCRGGPITRFSFTANPETPKVMTYRAECHGEVRTLVVPRLAAGNVSALDPSKDERA